MQFHKDFPWNKGLWIWRLDACLGGNIDAIIKKCKDYDVSYLLIKSGDGEKLWDQLTKAIVDKFHAAGIKVYSWTYNYGLNPLAEATVAIKSLDLGVDGHVFDAEGEYEHLVNNVHAAEVMLQAVRSRHPDKFLAHAPFPIISLHSAFPYLTFGKYCDAVMPQVYWGKWTNDKIKQSPQKGMVWTYEEFVKWQQNWIASGHADSVKPVIPIGQTFDDPSTRYVVTPADIHDFINTVKSYKSVNFWSFQHLLRDDCWNALRDAKLDPPTDADLGRVVVASEPEQPVQATTEAPVEAPVEQPAPVDTTPVVTTTETNPGDVVVTTPQSGDTITTNTQPDGTVVTVVEPAAEEAPVQEEVAEGIPVKVPDYTNSTIKVTPDTSHPSGVKITVTTHKTHQDYFVEFIKRLLSLFKRK